VSGKNLDLLLNYGINMDKTIKKGGKK